MITQVDAILIVAGVLAVIAIILLWLGHKIGNRLEAIRIGISEHRKFQTDRLDSIAKVIRAIEK